MIRHCARCDSDKDISEFGSKRGTKDGIHVWCRDCARAYSRMRRLDPENREKDRLYARERRQKPEVRARQKITDAEWNARNAKLRTSYNRSEQKRAAGRAYMKTEKARATNRIVAENRRAAKLGSGRVSADDWRQVLERFNHRCAYCLATGDLHMDHLVPLSRGGSHLPENVVPACRTCNLSKGNRDLLWFLAHSSALKAA